MGEIKVVNIMIIKKAFIIVVAAALFSACKSEEKGSEDNRVEILTGKYEQPRKQVLFDFDWHFYKGDLEDGQNPNLDDSGWRLLDLPHDWSIEDIPGTGSPLDSNAIGGVSSGFFVGGTGWYRKNFKVDPLLGNKRFYLQFDGIYMNADVWLNNHHLGNHPYGYTTFGYDISDLIDFSKENTLAVKVRNEGKNSRWYSGSGIYRHVWLIISEKVYIPNWGIIIATPDVNPDTARVSIGVQINNDTDIRKEVSVLTFIHGPDMKNITKTEEKVNIMADSKSSIDVICDLPYPQLWSVDSPNLYTAVIQVFSNGEKIDEVGNIFGIRSIEFGIDDGFKLNGEKVLLKGGCMHHGNGPLGAAAYDRAEERRVELMKASGFNAIRCAHNPPSEAFLNACDKLGILVIDEAFDMWRKAKNSHDYHLYFDEWWQKDIESMVLRDRNHPSIIMWSTGNEIPERADPEGVETSKMLAGYIRKLDPTRPVTSAVNGLNPDKDPFFATLDIAGYNYAAGGDHWKENIYAQDHLRVPDRLMYGAESYPLEAYGSWMAVVDYPFVVGDFVWTGFDYLGEASIGWLGYMQKKEFYPWSHAYCGDIDICGWKRPQSYYRDVLWENTDKPHVFVVPPEPSYNTNPEKMEWSKWEWHDVVRSWNWDGYEGRELEVHVYNASESTELILNGKSMGEKSTNRENQWIAKWKVPYEKGVLKAINYHNGSKLSGDELHTAHPPVRIRLNPDRLKIKADGQDLCYVTVELVDENNIRNPTIRQAVSFKIDGPGVVAAVASSDPMSTESYRAGHRTTFQGRCLVIIKSEKTPGNIRLRVNSGDLPEAEVMIESSLITN